MVTQESKEVYVNEIVAESAIGYCFSAVHLVKELAKRLLPCEDPPARIRLFSHSS